MKTLSIKYLTITAAVLCLTACGKDTQSVQTKTNDAVVPSNSANLNNSVDIPNGAVQKTNSQSAAVAKPPIVTIKKRMSYGKARKLLLAAGWQTPALPEGGYQETDDKIISSCSGSVALCNKLPEIDSCSGSGEGYCAMIFESAEKKLYVTTSGGLGNDTVIDSWEVK